MSESTPDDDEETVNLDSATMIFSSCALLFGLKRTGVILCVFKATCSLGIDGLSVQMELHTNKKIIAVLGGARFCTFRHSHLHVFQLLGL